MANPQSLETLFRIKFDPRIYHCTKYNKLKGALVDPASGRAAGSCFNASKSGTVGCPLLVKGKDVYIKYKIIILYVYIYIQACVFFILGVTMTYHLDRIELMKLIEMTLEVHEIPP